MKKKKDKEIIKSVLKGAQDMRKREQVFVALIALLLVTGIVFNTATAISSQQSNAGQPARDTTTIFPVLDAPLAKVDGLVIIHNGKPYFLDFKESNP